MESDKCPFCKDRGPCNNPECPYRGNYEKK